MMRIKTVFAAVILVVTAIATVPVVGVAQQNTESSDSNESVMAPGEHFSGVLGVQGAELTGEIERRTFRIKIARGASDEARAAIVAEKIHEVEARLADLEHRKRVLDHARGNGTISNGFYNAQMAIITAQQSNLQRQLDASESASAGLPPELLKRKGINASAIRVLKENASTMIGPEVAANARAIAGPNVGTSLSNSPVSVTIDPRTDIDPGVNLTVTEEPPPKPPIDTGSTTTTDDDGDEEDDDPLTIELG